MTYLVPKERQALRVLLGLDPAGTAEKQAAQKALLPLLTPPAPKAPTQPFRLEIVVGEYRLVQGAAGELVAYRHGELWRDCAGDQLVCALGHALQDAVDLLKSCGAYSWTKSGDPNAVQQAAGWHEIAVAFLKQIGAW